jgi:peptidoglycan/xylan/chitin deacetylase (PgdA/CDA1 family)
MNSADNFERQLAFYAEHYTAVSLTDLDMYFDRQRWDKERPGLIISFDDGLSSNYSVAAPLLEKYGFHGWFFAPVDFIAAAPSEQLSFSVAHQIVPDSTSLEADRVAMSWTELRDLDRRQHVIGCHTRSHLRMSPGLPSAVLEYEIITGKAVLEEMLGHTCACYAWVGGEECTYTSDAARMIRKAGYKYSFTTNSFPITRNACPHRLERSNIETVFSPALTSFQLCGFQDLRFAPKRRRVGGTIQAQ